MKALILAAGFGTRLQPLTNFIPKPMVPVAGVPNIERLIRHLHSLGIREFRINLHHLPIPLIDHLSQGFGLDIQIDFFQETRILGTGGGIKRMMEGTDDDLFIVVNGDVLFTPDLSVALAQHIKTGALATLLTRTTENAEAIGAVAVDAENRVCRLVSAGNMSLENLKMFTGVHILSPQIKSLLPDDGCIVRRTYIPMVERGDALFAHTDESYFCDLGTPAHFLEANIALVTGDILIKGFHPSPQGCFIGDNVTLQPGSKVLRGCCIGNNAVIGAGVELKNTVVMPSAVVNQSLNNAIVCSDGGVIEL